MPIASETLVLEHERSVHVKTVRCDGPGCSEAVHERDFTTRHRDDATEYEFGTTVGWWFLHRDPGDPRVAWAEPLAFHAWSCVRNAMLGLQEPTNA